MIAALLPRVPRGRKPVDVLLRIDPYGSRYGADIIALGQMRRISIPVSPSDLKTLNQQLHEALTLAVQCHHQASSADDERERLNTLSEIGHFTYKKIFGDPAQNPLHGLLSGLESSSLSVASEGFFLPWELLYPDSPADNPSYERFLGLRHVISRVIIQDERPGDFLDPEILVAERPCLGLMAYDGLPAVSRQEIPFFEALERSGKIDLHKLRPLDAGCRDREFKEVRSFLGRPLDVAHFACHAAHVDEAANLSFLLLSERFSITIQDFVVQNLRVNGYPLVMMNACEGGKLNPLGTFDFVSEFLRSGARGVVATECEVPDQWAAQMAETLYNQLLSGRPLGKSLLIARREMLRKGNPVGLMYALYAPPDLRLRRKGS